MDHLSGSGSNKENDHFVPSLQECTDNPVVLSSDARGRGGIRSFEETLAELRRENFRLRLLCYNYEQVYKKSTNPQDFESSRLFAAEAENLSLKESIAEKHGLLIAASKMIDVLKEENDTFEQQLRELKKRFEANEEEWRRKYDALYQELQQTKALVRNQELELMTQDNDKMRQQNESQCRIAELEAHLQSTNAELDRKQRELNCFQREAEKLRSTLEQFEKEQQQIASSQAAASHACDCMSVSCQQRLDELTSIVRVLQKQLTDAGLEPHVSSRFEQTDDNSKNLCVRHPFSPITSNTEKPVPAEHIPTDGDHNLVEDEDDPSGRIAYLSRRLNSARRLLLEIGNEKLRQDKLISRLQATHDREQNTLNEHCRSLREQLEKQNQLHSAELVRRDDEIQRLHQRVTKLIGEIDSLMAARSSLMSEVDKAREHISRLQWEHTEVYEKMTKELREKQRIIQQLQIALATFEVRDVTQFSLPDEAHMADISSMHDDGKPISGENGPRESDSKDNGSGDEEAVLRHQLLSLSRLSQEPSHKMPTPIGDTSTKQVLVFSEMRVEDSSRKKQSFETDTYTLADKMPIGSEINCPESKTDNTPEDTNTASLASENVSSFDVTKEVGDQLSSLSGADLYGNLPTVSTPPHILDSPNYSNGVGPIGCRYSPITTSDVSSRSLSEKPTKARTPQNRSNKNVMLSTSGIIHFASIGGAATPPSATREDHSRNADRTNSTQPHSAFDPGANPPPPACAIRELYNLIHNLKLQLDNVKFTEHSFVEMVNRSLTTAGINASFQFSPQKTRASLLLKSAQFVAHDSSSFVPEMPHPSKSAESRRIEASKANATYGGTSTLFDDPNTSFQSAHLADRSMLSTGGLNMTVAELRMCPASPNADALSPNVPSSPGSPRGPILRPSRLPKAVAKPSNLVGSASVCEGISHEITTRLPPFSASFTVGEDGDVWPRRDKVPQHSAMGDVTMVEWQNRDLFERLARATARLRDALEECAEVGSELWQGDVSQRLLLMLSDNPLDDAQSHPDPDQVGINRSTLERNSPEHVPTKPELDLSFGFVAQNRSVRFDDVNRLPLSFDLIDGDESLTQLYGSAWKSGAFIASMPECPQRPSQCLVEHSRLNMTTDMESSSQQIAVCRDPVAYSAAPTVCDVHTPRMPVTSSDSIVNEGLPSAQIKTSQIENSDHETQQQRKEQADSHSASRLEECDSTAKHLEDLSRLAEHLSSAQDRVAWLERERQELLGLLPESTYTGTSLSDLASAWNQLHEEQKELKHRLAQYVPSEDYRQLKGLVDALRSDLSSREQTIISQKDQLNHFMQQFLKADISTGSGDFMDCVDTWFSRFVSLRDSVDALRQEHSNLIQKFDQTVPKADFDKLQRHFESATAQLASSDDRLGKIEQLIFTEFPEKSEQPILCAVELLITELRELRHAVDQLTQEQQVAYSFLRDICTVPDPGTLTGFVEAVTDGWRSMEHNLKQMTAETNQALDLLRGMNLATVHDPDTLCGYVEACIKYLTERQDEINRLGLLCEQNEECLRLTVPISDFDILKVELDRVNQELEETRRELRAAEAQLDEALENKNERIACLEKELDDIQERQVAYDAERNEAIALINKKTSHSATTDNWIYTIGHICDEFSEITASMNQLRCEYQLILSECQELREHVAELNENSSRVQQEHETALAALRETLTLDFTKKLETLTEEQVKSMEHFSEQLEAARKKEEQLKAELSRRDSQLLEAGRKLHEADQEITHLRDSIALHIQSAEAASDAAKAHQSRADQLASHLECLREEHRKCPIPLDLVDAQTSPAAGYNSAVDKCDVATSLHPASVELNQARAQKYGELKTVAFEIKEKLVRRTEKLEAALTEVARLRSVIQQDKEHASRILEEVEDLRKQAIRKNKRIHELETELSQLKALRAGSHPVSSAHHTRSSARTISEVEQPRGAQIRPCGAHSAQISTSPAVVGYNTVSLLHCPDTPFIDPMEANVESAPQLDPTNLVCSSAASSNTSPSMSGQSPDAVHNGGRCERCEKVHGLILGMRRLTIELQRRLDIDLRGEYSLLATLDTFEPQRLTQESSEHQGTANRTVPRSRSASTSNLVANCSVTDTLQMSLSSSVGDLRTMVKSLHHARSRLKHYACEINRICGTVINRCNSEIEKPTVAGSPQFEDAVCLGKIKLSLEVLRRVYRRSKAFFEGLEVSKDITARNVLSDLHAVIKLLKGAKDSSSNGLSHSPSATVDEDKENHLIHGAAVRHPTTKQDLNSRDAMKYYQRYRDLTQGLDTMTRELTETNNVLSAARTNLERTAGVSLLASRQFTKTSPGTKSDSA